MKKREEERPFKFALSRAQQKFLKELKADLKNYYELPIDEDLYEEDTKQHLILKALYSMPITELNLWLVYTYGDYSNVTELAKELEITKQTLCSHIRSTKNYILNYVTNNYKPLTN